METMVLECLNQVRPLFADRAGKVWVGGWIPAQDINNLEAWTSSTLRVVGYSRRATLAEIAEDLR
jgi:hypothetical protein